MYNLIPIHVNLGRNARRDENYMTIGNKGKGRRVRRRGRRRRRERRR
jgi:hypothetical protein